MHENYQIVELKAENILNLKAVRIRPDGKAVVITGDNEAGKSNVLNAIFMALAGEKPAVPIRKGEERGEVSVDLGDILIRKVWTQKGERLEVTNKEGAAFRSPQTLLNNILGRLSFNPIAFAELSKTTEGRRKQKQVLIDLVGLDFMELESERAKLFEDRTDKNRDLRRMEGSLSQMAVPLEDLPEVEISITEEMEKVEDLRRHREKFLAGERMFRDHQGDIDRTRTYINELKEKLAETEERLEIQYKAKIKRFEEVTETELQQAKEELAQVDVKNVRIREAIKYREVTARVQALAKESDDLTNDIERLDHAKSEQISEAQFPVDGLGFGEDGVTYKGLPFTQQSTARQYMLATAICMALNPKLKVVLLRDASVISNKNLQAICWLAEERGYQVWIERVADEPGKVGVYIENGEITHIDGKEVEKDDKEISA